jgi:hypothetical protein
MAPIRTAAKLQRHHQTGCIDQGRPTGALTGDDPAKAAIGSTLATIPAVILPPWRASAIDGIGTGPAFQAPAPKVPAGLFSKRIAFAIVPDAGSKSRGN